MDRERMIFLQEVKGEGWHPLAAVRRIREDSLFETGKEFNVAVDLKSVFGLTARQLHDVVGWLKGAVSDDVLERSLNR